jgi:RNA polymerase sigma-54 factor
LQASAQGIYEGLVASLIDKYLPQVAESQIKEIAAAENVSPEDVQLAVDILKTLNPKPGSVYGTENASYITPDVTIEKVDDSYVVRLNDSYVPKLHITNLYRQAADFDADTQKYIKKRLTAASWLINSIEQRRETIRKVVEEIVRVQKDFLDKGAAFLKPLSMKEVAEAIEVHESTVSRAVANKYAEIPGGIVSLKSFFQTGLGKGGSSEDFLASQAKAELEALKAKIDHHDLNSDLDRHRDEIQQMLEQDIVSAYYYQGGQLQVGLRNDKTLQEAQRILDTPGEYHRILKGKSE